MDPRKRLGQLKGLSSHEKGMVYLKLMDCGDDVWQRELPDFLDDDAVATVLRQKHLKEKVEAAPTQADEFSALSAAVPAFSWPAGSEPSMKTLEQYLFDFKCLVGLVPLAINETWDKIQGLDHSPFFKSSTELAAFVASAIGSPMSGSGQQVANNRIAQFCRILDCLRCSSSGSDRLDFHFSMESTATASCSTSTQTARCLKRKRPDFLFEFREFVFMLGEGKEDEHEFAKACNEISAKLTKVPGWVLGQVKFLLAFAVAGFKWQLFLKRGSGDEPEAVGNIFDLQLVSDRVKLALVFVKLYFVCLSMCHSHVSMGMLPLFRTHKRAQPLSTVQLDGEGCVKVIKKWGAFKARFGVELRNIKKAYGVGVEQLVSAVAFPEVSNKGSYAVRTAPLGLPARAMLKSVDDCKRLVRDLLTAIAALHKVGLVHRDIRLDNVIWSPERKCYVLIDVEIVCKAGMKIAFLLTDYTSRTLVHRKYTKSSDLHQLGVLVKGLRPLSDMTPECEAFVNRLQSHGSDCTAQLMLRDAWLAPKVEA